MYYSVPSSTSTYYIYCSFCGRNSYATPESISKADLAKWQNHVCDEYCNGFSCKKCYLINDNEHHEFYVEDEKYFLCYRCRKAGKGTNIRPFWKLPRNAQMLTTRGQFIQSRTTQSYRSGAPYNHEDLWYTKYYLKLSDYQKKWENIADDYKIFSDLTAKNIC